MFSTSTDQVSVSYTENNLKMKRDFGPHLILQLNNLLSIKEGLCQTV